MVKESAIANKKTLLFDGVWTARTTLQMTDSVEGVKREMKRFNSIQPKYKV